MQIVQVKPSIFVLQKASSVKTLIKGTQNRNDRPLPNNPSRVAGPEPNLHKGIQNAHGCHASRMSQFTVIMYRDTVERAKQVPVWR